jgi:polysaccharide chain length determinant protein (PEP-CTERM system associated)
VPMREQPENIDMKIVRGFIRRRKSVFLTVSSIVFSIAIIFAVFFTTKIYLSTATFLVEGHMPDEIVKGMSGGYTEERLQAITQQVLGREKLLEIIQQYNLYGNPKDQGDVESAIKKMREDIIIRTIKAEDLDKRPSRARYSTVAFTLSYQGNDPETVQKTTSRLASFYVEKNEQAKEQFVAQTTAVLQQRLNQLKEQADIMGARLNGFKRQHAGELPESISFNLDQVYKLTAQLEELNSKISVLEDKGKIPEGYLGAYSAQGSAGGSQPSNDLWTRLAQLKAQLFNLRTRYSEKHPDVIKVRNEIQQLETKLGDTAEQSGKATDNARNLELKKYTKQRDEIQRRINEFTRRNQIAPLLGTEYTRLSTDYDNAMKQYNDAKMKLAEAKAVKETDDSSLGERFIIIDQPVVPQKPENPQQGKILLAGLFLAMFFGLFASILAENFDHSIKTAEQLQKITKLPVLTVIPFIENDDGKNETKKNQISKILNLITGKTTA